MTDYENEVAMKFTDEIKVELIDSCGSDQRIAEAARVSTKGSISQQEIDQLELTGLINYLMKHRHGTPFEHNSITIRVNAPIFVWREWHRHRIGFSYNEESARYKVLDPVFYLPPRERPMMKVDNWKSGRPKFTECTDTIHEVLCSKLKYSYILAYQSYLDLLGLNIDPGLARDCLPVGIFSSCYVTCNARSLMAFLSLRTHDEAAKFVSYPLYEIEVAARKLEDIFTKLFPITAKAFKDNGRVSP